MKKLILLVLLSFCFTQNAETKLNRKGLGFQFHMMPQAMTITEISDASGYGIYVPLDFGKLFVEPYFSIYQTLHSETAGTTTYEYLERSATFGIGLFFNKIITDGKSRLYYGLRWSKLDYTSETASASGGKIVTESSPTMISPTIGVEYLLIENVSFGGEASFHMMDYDQTIDDVTLGVKFQALMPMFLIRMYF